MAPWFSTPSLWWLSVTALSRGRALGRKRARQRCEVCVSCCAWRMGPKKKRRSGAGRFDQECQKRVDPFRKVNP